MSNMFDMSGATQGVKVSESNYLKPGIHPVVFKGITEEEYTDKTGTKGTYLMASFEKDVDGVIYQHKERIFAPKSGERKQNAFDATRVNPSEAEQFLIKLRQFVTALNAELDAKIESGEVKFSASSFGEFVKLMQSATDPAIGSTTEIKLLPNGNFASMPAFPAQINKDGVLYVGTKFIGKNLTLSAYEKSKVDAALTAAPTNMNNNNQGGGVIGSMGPDFSTAGEVDDLPF